MKRIVLCILLAATAPAPVLAQTAAPLVVGAVRDQTGEPVAGARVALFGPARPVAEGSTGSDGTFALVAQGVSEARITCAFCRPARLRVIEGEPVVAIVFRYLALLREGPGPADLDALPYARVESAASLTPFVVLAGSRGIFPGAVLSNRGLSPAGGLIVDDGAANYDVAANVSPFFTLPAHAVDLTGAYDARAAYRYGDRAGAGTFVVAPPPGAPELAAGAGGDAFTTLHLQNGATAYDAAVSGNSTEHRARVEVQSAQRFTDGSVDETVALGSGTLAPSSNDWLAQSFDSARVSAQVVRATRRYADVTLDRGTYTTQLPGTWIGSHWSDGTVRAGIETLGAANGFLEAGMRHSYAFYDAAGRIPTVSAGIDQSSVAAGVRSDFEKTSLHAALAAYQIAYDGGPIDAEYARSSNAAGTALLAPSLDAQFRPGERWDVDVLAASSFALPTLLERYAKPPASGLLAVDRNALVQTTVGYSDRARMRAALTAYRQNTNGFDTGLVSGAGVSLAWQLAPRLALRSWALRETDTTQPVVPVVRFTPSQIAQTVGSAWLTYDLPGVRIDAIYRRDLLERTGVSHFDYALTGSAGGRARWFVTSEVRQGMRFTGLGLRFL